MPYYDWVKMKEMAIEATEKHKLLFMTEVVSYLPCTYSAFFNNKMNEDEDILQAFLLLRRQPNSDLSFANGFAALRHSLISINTLDCSFFAPTMMREQEKSLANCPGRSELNASATRKLRFSKNSFLHAAASEPVSEC